MLGEGGVERLHDPGPGGLLLISLAPLVVNPIASCMSSVSALVASTTTFPFSASPQRPDDIVQGAEGHRQHDDLTEVRDLPDRLARRLAHLVSRTSKPPSNELPALPLPMIPIRTRTSPAFSDHTPLAPYEQAVLTGGSTPLSDTGASAPPSEQGRWLLEVT